MSRTHYDYALCPIKTGFYQQTLDMFVQRDKIFCKRHLVKTEIVLFVILWPTVAVSDSGPAHTYFMNHRNSLFLDVRLNFLII